MYIYIIYISIFISIIIIHSHIIIGSLTYYDSRSVGLSYFPLKGREVTLSCFKLELFFLLFIFQDLLLANPGIGYLKIFLVNHYISLLVGWSTCHDFQKKPGTFKASIGALIKYPPDSSF